MYSCSINEETARLFAEAGTLLKIETNYAIPIAEYSKYPDEEEYLIPPGMFFEVINYKKNSDSYDEIHVKLAQVKIRSFKLEDMVLDISKQHVKLRQFNPESGGQVWFIQGRYIRNSETG